VLRAALLPQQERPQDQHHQGHPPRGGVPLRERAGRNRERLQSHFPRQGADQERRRRHGAGAPPGHPHGGHSPHVAATAPAGLAAAGIRCGRATGRRGHSAAASMATPTPPSTRRSQSWPPRRALCGRKHGYSAESRFSRKTTSFSITKLIVVAAPWDTTHASVLRHEVSGNASSISRFTPTAMKNVVPYNRMKLLTCFRPPVALNVNRLFST